MKLQHFTKTLLICLSITSSLSSRAQKYTSYKGLVMAGYQGWFNTPEDGANRKWNHYAGKGGKFEPGSCKFDLWPDMDEYKQKYKTPFQFANGQPAYLFSSYDESTVDLHFKWMKEYGIDGVFLQRFVVTLSSEKGRNHSDKVLRSVLKAAKKYDRTVAIMYDLSGMKAEQYSIVEEDWKHIINDFEINNPKKYKNYLFHNGKPLVAIWGIGFNDNRKYGFEEANKIVDFLKAPSQYGNCAIHLGVPARWRELKTDATEDPQLHTIIRKADIVHPWFVGRYKDNKSYTRFKNLIREDIAWCKENKIDYVPTVFPGFSWYNMKKDTPSDMIPRNKGNFFWMQIAGAIESGAEMIYIAMFDEIDEATAIFKCSHEVPVGESKFLPIENEVKTDHYLWLSGMAKKMLSKQIPFQDKQPQRP